MTTHLVRDVQEQRAVRAYYDGLLYRLEMDALEDLEARAAAGILGPPKPSRRERLAQFVNWLLYWRWPGQA